MNERELLSTLKSLNVSIAAKGETLLVSDPQRRLTNDLRAAIASRKPSLLRLLQASAAAAPRLAIAPADPRDSYPVSYSQARLYTLQSLAPETVAYNVQLAFRFSRPLDANAIQAALEKLVARHESLRTSFHMEDDGLVQRIHDHATIEIEIVPLAADAIEAQVVEGARPFDLSAAPLFRARAFQIDGAISALAFDLHHIITDGVSMQLLIRDFDRLLAGESPKRPPLQFKDFAVWQAEGEGSALVERQSRYWTDQYKTVPPPLALPLDRPRGKTRSFEGDTLEAELSPEAVEALRQMRRSQGATLYVALHACFSALLARLSGQEDIVLGTSVAGRDAPGLEETIGVFTNTLALRSRPERGKPFAAYLAEVRELCLGAFDNALFPFELLAERIPLERDASRNPLFDAMLVLQNYESARAADAGASEAIELPTKTSKIDLNLSVIESKSSIRLRFEYATQLFDAATIKRYASSLERLILHAARDIEAPIGKLAVIDDDDRRRMLREFNDTQVSYPDSHTIPALFARACERFPDRIAIVAGDRSMTYAELDARSSRLASKLEKELAISPDAVIGLMARRRAELFVGQMGILKAGAAYLPIDPDYPSERIEYMLADSGCQALLASDADAFRLAYDGPVFDLGACASLPPEAEARALPAGSPSDLAYVIYTSGSTGKPKGVMIEHRAVANLMKGMEDAVGMREGRAIVSVTTICFDIFALESLLPLAIGMKIVLADEEAQRDPARLCEIVASSGADMLQATPSLAKLVFAEPYARERLRGVKIFLVGGEPFTEAMRALMRASSDGEIYNMYGPTETTVWSTTSLVSSGRIHIGRPIANTRIYIVDPQGEELTPLGSVGELCIAGDGLARGYRGREALTREKFAPNPFEPGQKMYRTGDLARWLPDGNLECLGRIDGQVKIRGHRIELGEIEAALGAIPGVREAVVAVKSINGTEALVGYYTADAEIEAAPLREALGLTLPVFMVPSVFVRLDAIPLTSNGKIDRRALPQPAPQSASQIEYVAPRNALEQTLAEMWQSILRAPRVGIHDDFYELGGDSLLMVRVASKAKQAGLTVLPAQLMQAPTIAGLAGLLSAERPVKAESSPTGALPLSPMQRSFFSAPPKRRWVIPARFDLRRRITLEQLRAAVSIVWAHHDGLRCRFEKIDGQWSARIPEPEAGDVEAVCWAEDISKLSESDQAKRLDAAWHEVRADLDYERGRNLRVVLYERGPGQPQRVHVVAHHLVADVESLRLILADLASASAQVVAGEKPHLPPKSAPARAILERIDATSRSDATRAELAYWKSVPWSRMKRPPIDTGLGYERNVFGSVAQFRAELSPESTALLEESLRCAGASMLDALFLGIAEGICAWAGCDWMHARAGSANGLALHCCPELDRSRTVAWLAAGRMYALQRPTSSEPLERLREIQRAIAATPSQGIGFDLLAWGCADEEATALRRASTYDYFFNYLGRVDGGPPPDPDAPTAPVPDRPGERVHHPSYDSPRGLLLFMEFLIHEDRLKVRCDYSENLHRAASVERFVATVFRELEGVALALQPAEAGAR